MSRLPPAKDRPLPAIEVRDATVGQWELFNEANQIR